MPRPIVLALIAVIAAACTSGASPSASVAPSASTAPPAESAPPSVAPNTPAPTDDPSPTPEPIPATPATWQQPTTAGPTPAAREDHTWTVDGDGDAATTAYLFGGRSGSRAFADLHAYDLATDTWRPITPANAGPSARFGHEAVWLAGRGLVVWAGQASATTFFNDLWLYDPAANRWTRLPNGGATPTPRYGSCSGIGPDGRLWISHGFTEDGTRFADTRAYDFAT
ncbi:MAG TPA: kelch repeat-containing protein, partial [Candidatus Limnocylindrales bacterium]|nr:kelch repeat-containing protein [Candidatus Limnocylindrales bacterium]